MHPMGVGDVLDGAFKLLKANARTIVLVVAAIVVPVQLVASFAVRRQVGVGLINIINDPTLAQSQQDVGLGNAAVSIVTGLVSLLTAPLIAGAVSRVVATSYLGGELGPAEALRITVRRFWPLLGASFLVGLAHVAGVLLCVLPILVPFTLYTATTPALMIEEVGAVEAMRRSWRLLRPRFWAVCGVLLLARLIAGFLGNILGTVPSTVAVFTGGSLAWFFIALGGVVSSIVSAPIAAIVSTLLYFDARIRHEGFDLQVMANDLERGAAR
jgi:hypothetical protein